jgi:hypothetical protein
LGLREVLVLPAKGVFAAQRLEGKSNLLRLRQEIPLNDDELRAVNDGIEAHEALVSSLRALLR